MRINQNIAAFNAYRNLSQTQGSQAKSLEKLSSGFRINRAADDASGLVNSENLRSQIGGLKVATRNAQDAISLVQTAEGAQTEVHSILQRMRDLTVQSGNLGTNDQAALDANQSEIDQLAEELDRISEQTQFGTKKILNGDFSVTEATAGTASFTFTAGAATDTQALKVSVDGAAKSVNIDSVDTAAEVVTKLNTGLSGVAKATLGDDGKTITITSDTTGTDSKISAVSLEVGTGGAADDASIGTVTTDDGAAETGKGAVFQVGANAGQNVEVEIESVSSSDLGVNALDLASGTTAKIDSALEAIDKAIGTVSENRATLGAFQNRMESTIRNVSVAVENLSAAESRIRDTDMAQEMVNFTRSQILSQAGTAMLAQANQVPQSVLSLLR